MKNKKQIATILVAAVVAFGLFVATCPQLVLAVPTGSDNGTAENMQFPDQIAGETVFNQIQADANYLVIQNTGDLINGLEDGLWVEVSIPVMYNDSANDTYTGGSWSTTIMYGRSISKYAIWMKIAEDDNTTWIQVETYASYDNEAFHDDRNWCVINDSTTGGYTFNNGDHMWIKIGIDETDDSHDMYEGLYTSQEAGDYDPWSDAASPEYYWGRWCIRGYS